MGYLEDSIQFKEQRERKAKAIVRYAKSIAHEWYSTTSNTTQLGDDFLLVAGALMELSLAVDDLAQNIIDKDFTV